MNATKALGSLSTIGIYGLVAACQWMSESAAPDLVPVTLPSLTDTYECAPTTREAHDESINPGQGRFRDDGTFRSESLYTILGSRIVFRPGGAGGVFADGSLSMKYMWWRVREGTLTIEGRRLDGPAPPLRARIPDGYGNVGFQATSIIFPSPGCWEVIGTVGGDSITFTVLVEKIGNGPCGKEFWAPNETGGQVAMTTWHEERITDSMHGFGSFVSMANANMKGVRKESGERVRFSLF